MTSCAAYPLIFTDLDGTLLDHNSYSAQPADILIQQILDQSIGYVIPITSKTSAEMRSLQRSIPLSETISVTENGSVINMPHGYPFAVASDPQKFWTGSLPCRRYCGSILPDLPICRRPRFQRPPDSGYPSHSSPSNGKHRNRFCGRDRLQLWKS